MNNLVGMSATETLQGRAQQEVKQHRIEANATFGRPFLFGILLAIAIFTLPNVLSRRNGTPRFNPLPFYWLERSIALSSLLMTTGILIKQNRQEKRANQLAEISLQSNRQLEREIVKVSASIEELRRHPPNASNRHAQIEVMRQVDEWQAARKMLEETLAEVRQGTSNN